MLRVLSLRFSLPKQDESLCALSTNEKLGDPHCHTTDHIFPLTLSLASKYLELSPYAMIGLVKFGRSAHLFLQKSIPFARDCVGQFRRTILYERLESESKIFD